MISMNRRANSLKSLVLFSTLALTGCPENTTGSNTAAPPPAQVQPATTPPKPLITKPQVADWCKEHSVPESICTRCNEKLVAEFKAKNDWCKEHGLPESQCVKCHPDLEAKFKAMAPK